MPECHGILSLNVQKVTNFSVESSVSGYYSVVFIQSTFQFINLMMKFNKIRALIRKPK